MITTYEQSKKLKELGFEEPTHNSYWLENGERTPFTHLENFNKSETVVSAPSISEALQWIREKKGIELGIYPEMQSLRDGLKELCYNYKAFDLSNNCKRIYFAINFYRIDSHPLAESALLDAVLDY